MKKPCCLCKEKYKGYGNNAEPLMKGRCCNRCNILKVIPARLEELGFIRKKIVFGIVGIENVELNKS